MAATPTKVLIVSNFIADDFYAAMNTTREEWEEDIVARIKVMVRAIAPRVFGTESVAFSLVNIADASAEEIITQLETVQLAVFSGGPQNIRDTKAEHLAEADRLRDVLAAALERFEQGVLPDLRLITLCLSHQVLGELLQMEVVDSGESQLKREYRPMKVCLPKAEDKVRLEPVDEEDDLVEGLALHRYHVRFRESEPDAPLRAVEFASLHHEDWCNDKICYGMLVYDPQGEVRIVSTQFHPEANFCADSTEEQRDRMTGLIGNAFGARAAVPQALSPEKTGKNP